jgi:WD40 repeat protein
VVVWTSSGPSPLADGASGLAALPDGRLAVGRRDGRLGFFDRETHREETADNVPGPITDLAADRSGRFLAACTGEHMQDLTVWRDGQLLCTKKAIHIVIHSIAIGADGRVYTGGERDRSIALWDLHTGDEIDRRSSPGKDVMALAVSRDAQHSVSCADCSCWMLWDADYPLPRWIHDGIGWCALETPDGKAVLLASSGHLTLHDWTGEVHGKRRWPGWSRLAWGPNDDLWFTTTGDRDHGNSIWRASWQRVHASLTRPGWDTETGH